MMSTTNLRTTSSNNIDRCAVSAVFSFQPSASTFTSIDIATGASVDMSIPASDSNSITMNTSSTTDMNTTSAGDSSSTMNEVPTSSSSTVKPQPHHPSPHVTTEQTIHATETTAQKDVSNSSRMEERLNKANEQVRTKAVPGADINMNTTTSPTPIMVDAELTIAAAANGEDVTNLNSSDRLVDVEVVHSPGSYRQRVPEVKVIPLTPIKELRKRSFSPDANEEKSPTKFAPPSTIRSPPPAPSATSPASQQSQPLSSATSWPWYLVSAVAGAPNLSYVGFNAINSCNTDLPDDASDWWGFDALTTNSPTATSMTDDAKKEEEVKVEAEQYSKRQRLSGDRVAGTSPISDSTSPTQMTNLPRDSHAFSLLGQMGQDSYFSISNSLIGCAVMGVADGVGGWRDNGIDSGEISRAIMRAARNIALKQCADAASNSTATSPFTLNPSDILTRAYLQVKAAGEVEAGSTTACIVALTPVPVKTLVPEEAISPSNRAIQPAASTPMAGSTTMTSTTTTTSTTAAAMTLDSATLASFLSSTAAMTDIMSALVDVNQNMMSTEVGMIHTESKTTTTTTVSTNSMEVESTTISTTADSMHAPISKPVTTAAHPKTPDSCAIDISPEPVVATPTTSTNTIASWESDSCYLSAANLGDSGYMILRRDLNGVYRIVQMSDLQRSGRTVKQLAIIPPRFAHDSYCDDSPSEAELYAHLVKEDDLLILASDGLWDNLIAGEWSSLPFIFGWRSVAENERIAKQRKVRMCEAVEQIASECAIAMAKQRATIVGHEQAQQQVDDAMNLGGEEEKIESSTSSLSFSSTSHPSTFISSTANSADGSRSPSSSMILSVNTSNSRFDLHSATMIDMDLEVDQETNTGVLFGQLDAPMNETTTEPEKVPTPPPAALAAQPKPTTPTPPFDWDSFEVKLFASHLKQFAESFMPKPEGKPDDLSILVSKIKKQHTITS